MKTYEPLFLKYRPQTLEDLVGQGSVKQVLVNAINNNKLVHAYLFTGPRGAGKTSSARILAKCLNCQNFDQATTRPCGECNSCKDIASSSSIDVVEIDAASHGHVEDARQLIERVNLGTVGSRYKVYIIDEVHMLSTAAFNALLKVFEEPPENVVFILATTEEDKVLPTIVSRCQKFSFKSISQRDCVERLKFVAANEKIAIEDEALQVIAKRADGALRDALGLLDQISVFASQGEADSIKQEQVLELLGGISIEDLKSISSAIFKKDISTLLNTLDEVYAKGKEALAICKELDSFLLEFLEYKGFKDLSIENDSSNSQIFDELLQLNPDLENFELVQIIDTISELEYKLKQSTQAKSLFRAALLKVAFREDISIVKDLERRLASLEQNLSSGQKIEMRAPVVSAAPIPKPTAPVSRPAAPSPAPEKPVFVETPEPVAQEPAMAKPLSSPASSDSSSEDFLLYLSPACKGIYISSKASYQGINNGIASICMPSKFKFLKPKLEAKKEEIISAIAQEYSADVQGLEVKLSDTIPEPKDKQILAAVPDKQEQIKKKVEQKLNSVSIEAKEASNNIPVQESKTSNRNTEPEEIDLESKPVSSHKIKEAVEMGISIFGGSKVIS